VEQSCHDQNKQHSILLDMAEKLPQLIDTSFSGGFRKKQPASQLQDCKKFYKIAKFHHDFVKTGCYKK